MTLKTYTGGCHCGAIRYEADADLGKGTVRCNCSICSKARAWFAIVKADHVRVLTGADAMADYQWTPAGKPHAFLHYRFCRTCGIRMFAQGDDGSPGGAFYAIAIASLDGTNPDELAASIKYVDGRHDHFDRAPQNTVM